MQLLSNYTYEDYRKRDDYRQVLSYSGLKELDRSPAHFQAYKRRPSEYTKAMQLGDAFHLLTLEPERFGDRVVLWPGKYRRGKEWTQFASDHTGKVILSADENEVITHMSEQLVAHSLTRAILALPDRQVEQWVFWQHEYGFPCVARLDLVSEKHGLIVDVKTAADAGRSFFERQVANLRYHWQAAWYKAGVRAALGEDYNFLFAVVEKSDPYAVAVYQPDEESLRVAEEQISKLCEVYAECLRVDEWPGYSWAEDIITLELPKWARR